MLFTAKREEAGALSLFRKHCTYHGLQIALSMHSLAGLKAICEGNNVTSDMIGERVAYTLHRRGLIRYSNDGEIKVTETGLLVAALAEAANLVTIKGTR
jgi:preprotein translocase subunit Sec61beta